MTSITTVKNQVALIDRSLSATFTFLRTWFVPHLKLKISVGQMALFNIIFFDEDGDIVFRGLLLENLDLSHLGIDSRTLLERKWISLGGTAWSVFDAHQIGCTVSLGRLLAARMKRLNNESTGSPATYRPRSDYFHTQHTQDSISDQFLVDTTDVSGDDALMRRGIQEFLARARGDGFTNKD